MIRENLSWVLLAGVLAVNPLSQGIAHPLGSARATEANLIKVQSWPGGPGWGRDEGRRDHCLQLRNRAQEIRQQIYYAPAWERERMERYLWGVRERLRDECWGGGRGWE
jgi:hypothetical protein